MFLDFYGLGEQPFGVTPDPRYLYLGASHREALASLFYGIKMGRGILALVAQPGMGKTSILFRFLDHLRPSARTAFLFQTQCDSVGLLRYMLADLGIDALGQDFVAMHEQLNELLIREAAAGRKVVLVIDEAQNLENHVLETARLLSDFETPREKLLQIVLVGQPQLAEKLQQAELAQLRQRIGIVGHLEPFNSLEVVHYIEHRLRVAGYTGDRLFRPLAAEEIARCSRGIPRNINNLCFNALSLGCAYHRKQIDVDLVHEAKSDLDFGPLAHQRPRSSLPVVRPTPRKPVAVIPGPRTRVPAFPLSEPRHRAGHVAVATLVLVLALLTSFFYRGDLKTAAAHTRKTLAAAVASLASHPIAIQTDVEGSTTLPSRNLANETSELGNGDAVDTTPVPEPTNSQTGTNPTVPVSQALGEQQVDVPATAGVEPGAPPQVELGGGTKTVIVQPHDNLRKICLQYLGSYNLELQTEISKLNPGLTDPDHVEAGQRIVLPRLVGDKPHVPQHSPRPDL